MWLVTKVSSHLTAFCDGEIAVSIIWSPKHNWWSLVMAYKWPKHILWSRWSCVTSRLAFGRCGSLSVHAWFLVTSLGLKQVAEVLTHTMFKYLTLYYYSSGNCFSGVCWQSPITQCSAQQILCSTYVVVLLAHFLTTIVRTIHKL